MTEAEKSKKEERDGIVLEIKARKELRKRLDHPLKLIKAAAEKELQKRQARVEKNREFKTYEEAHEAYGWGTITEQEFREIAEAIESGQEYVENTRTPVEIASDMLREITGRLEREIRDFEFLLLPEEEQARILREAEDRKKRREKRQ